MEDQKMSFQDYLKREVERVNGVYYPVRASLLRRVLVRHAACRKLHPNPDDEFCDPAIGPSDSIISKYVQEYERNRE